MCGVEHSDTSYFWARLGCLVRKRTEREGQPEGDRELQAKVGGIEKVLLLKVKILQLLHSIRRMLTAALVTL